MEGKWNASIPRCGEKEKITKMPFIVIFTVIEIFFFYF